MAARATDTARIGPTGTLAHLATLRERTTDPAMLTALDTAMTRRRDVVAAAAERAEQPPQWAHSLLARSTWTGQLGRGQREREVIAKVAVFRDRFDVQGDGLGEEPAGRDEQRIWRGLRDRLIAPQRNDDRDEDRHSKPTRHRAGTLTTRQPRRAGRSTLPRNRVDGAFAR